MKIAANISTLFREYPMCGRFEAARAAGFDGVEIQNPYAECASLLAQAAEAAGLPVVLINAPISPGRYPLGMACRPEMKASFRAQVPQIGEYVNALKARFVHVLAGPCGVGDDPQPCWDTYVENLLFAADALAPYGVQTLIEPLNPTDAPGYLLHSFGDACTVIERCGDRVGLQFDAYHAARMGLDPGAEFERLMPLIRHVQFADEPGRHEPGTGRIAFDAFVATLLNARYSAWVSAEYLPAGATDAGMKWLKDWRAWTT